MTAPALLIPSLLSLLVSTHVLPDDTLHRNLQVVVREDAVEVTFEVGMNDTTLTRLGQTIAPSTTWEGDPLALAQQFTDVAGKTVGSNLQLLIDGRVVPLKLADDEPAAKHHQTSRFVYRAEIPEWAASSTLELVDANWLEFDGQARVALKGKGVRIADSNAPLLVVRADPIDMNELTLDERREMLTIRAVVKP